MTPIAHFVPAARATYPMPPDNAWYLAQCKPREDRRAVENLRRQGFDSFAPLCQVERLRDRRWSTRTEALFPGYAFVKLNRIDHDWSKIRSTRGVSRLVRFGAHIPTIPESVVAEIRELDGSPLRARRARIGKGARVRILDGPFADIAAIFERSDGAERVILLIELMHREVRVSVANSAVVLL